MRSTSVCSVISWRAEDVDGNGINFWKQKGHREKMRTFLGILQRYLEVSDRARGSILAGRQRSLWWLQTTWHAENSGYCFSPLAWESKANGWLPQGEGRVVILTFNLLINKTTRNMFNIWMCIYIIYIYDNIQSMYMKQTVHITHVRTWKLIL